jgi:hypothetical protein
MRPYTGNRELLKRKLRLSGHEIGGKMLDTFEREKIFEASVTVLTMFQSQGA